MEHVASQAGRTRISAPPLACRSAISRCGTRRLGTWRLRLPGSWHIQILPLLVYRSGRRLTNRSLWSNKRSPEGALKVQDEWMASLRVGLLGTGYWALHVHGTALTASPQASLDGVWGRDPAKAHDLAARLRTKGYDDLDELLGSVDAVSIAVPPDIQASLAVRAARAGCHLMMDKPLALDVRSAQAVVDAVDEVGVAAILFFTQRFRPDMEDWTKASAEAGPWHSAHLVHYANIYGPGAPMPRLRGGNSTEPCGTSARTLWPPSCPLWAR